MIGQELVGTIFDGRYKIQSVLGQGGMGCVYQALELELNRIVALKVLHGASLNDSDSHQRFMQEGRILSSLTDRHIVTIYRLGIWQGQTPYIAMEYLEGESLRSRLNQDPIGSAHFCLRIGIQSCNALSVVHEMGIVHRDIKPNNIILLDKPESDYVKIVDFGLSKLVERPDEQKLTQTGLLIGTPQYLSPEQCAGQPADKRSDIYALGCVLYEILAGRPIFEVDNPIALLHKHTSEAPLALSSLSQVQNLPVGLEAALAKALAKDPAFRYQSMNEFKAALELVQSGRGNEVDREPLSVFAKAQSKYKPLTVALVSLLLLCLGVAVFYFYSHNNAPVSSEKISNDNYRVETLRAMEFAGQAKQAIARGNREEAAELSNRALGMLSSLGEIRSDDLNEQKLEFAVLQILAEVIPQTNLQSFKFTQRSTHFFEARFCKSSLVPTAIESRKIKLAILENAGDYIGAANTCCSQVYHYYNVGEVKTAESYLQKARTFMARAANVPFRSVPLSMESTYRITEAYSLFYTGRFTELRALMPVLLNLAESVSKQNLAEGSGVYLKIATLYEFLGDHKNAERILQIIETILNECQDYRYVHPTFVVRERAVLLCHQRRYKEAEQLLKQRIEENNYGIRKYSFDLRYELGNVLIRQGKYQEAEKTFKRCLEMAKAADTSNRKYVRRFYDGLASCYQKSGRPVAEKEALKSALALERKAHPEIALFEIYLLGRLSDVCFRLGQNEESTSYLQEAERLAAVYDNSPFGRTASLRNAQAEIIGIKASFLFRQKQYGKAIKLYRQALQLVTIMEIDDCPLKERLLDGLVAAQAQEK
ncbi:MAG: serine/threonine-protein kinase [Candidatus Obscuribacterales bacterium]|nr:serine/threonine-protein kinase [Candidatus Obscuribacterales bacterium]